MNFGYLSSVLSNRLGILGLLILVTNVLSADEVSKYALSYTNALILLTAFGYWVISFSLRVAGHRINGDWPSELGRIYSSLSISIVFVLLAVTFCAWMGYPLLLDRPVEVALLALALIVYELQLTILNGQGRSTDYTKLSLLRAVGIAVLCVSAFVTSVDFSKILLGLAIATIVPTILTRGSRSLFKHFSVSKIRRETLRRDLSVGILGTIHFGTYVFVNAPLRNAIGYSADANNLGYFIALQDILWGPLAIAGAAISISHNRGLLDEWTELGEASNAPSNKSTTSFVSIGLAITMPYVVGGLVVSVSLAGLLLTNASVSFFEEIAGLVLIANAMIQLLFVLNHIFFIRGNILPIAVTIAIASVSGPAALALMGSPANFQYAVLGQIVGLSISIGIAATVMWISRILRPDWATLGRSALATGIMYGAISLAMARMSGTSGLLISIFVGAITFFGAARLVGLRLFQTS